MRISLIFLLSIFIFFSCGKTKKDLNIVAHWSLNDNALDNSPYKLNGVIIGKPKIVKGVSDGNALDFNGKEFIEIDIKNNESKHIENLSSGSISIWFKARDWDFENTILPLFYYGGKEACDKKRSGDNTGMIIQIGHGGMYSSKNLFFTHFDRSCSHPTVCFNTNSKTEKIIPEKWYHFVGVVGENYNTGYLNGKELKDRHYNFKSDTASLFFKDYLFHEKIWIGKSIWMNKEVYFNGLIDDVKIYSTPLTKKEVEELYHSKTN